MTTKKSYNEGLLGKKLGMSQHFTEDGQCIPVTVLEVGPCYVLQVKESAASGSGHNYTAVQIGFQPKKAQRVSKPLRGHFEKAGKGCFEHVGEIRCDIEKLGWKNPGQEIVAGDVFQAGQYVDVTGTSMGKGFQGVVRRFGTKGQPMTRGTHEVRRHVGAIGCRKFPGRVFKNQIMPGHMGNERVTILNLQVVSVHPEKNLVLVKGAVPGQKGGLVVIRKAVKSMEAA